jgi:6-phosphogluconolactonase (cycloisomerase 2 family)
MVHKILVGGYSDSVSVLSFEASTPSNSKASLKLSSITKIGQNPSWVSKHPERNDLALATLEEADGRVVLLKINLISEGGEGEVEVIQTVSTKGADPCHVEWLEDEVVISNVRRPRPSIPRCVFEPILTMHSTHSTQART